MDNLSPEKRSIIEQRIAQDLSEIEDIKASQPEGSERDKLVRRIRDRVNRNKKLLNPVSRNSLLEKEKQKKLKQQRDSEMDPSINTPNVTNKESTPVTTQSTTHLTTQSPTRHRDGGISNNATDANNATDDPSMHDPPTEPHDPPSVSHVAQENRKRAPESAPSVATTKARRLEAQEQAPSTPVTTRTTMPAQVNVDGVPTSSLQLTPLQLNRMLTTPGGRKLNREMREMIARRRTRYDTLDGQRSIALGELTRLSQDVDRSEKQHLALDELEDTFTQADALAILEELDDQGYPPPVGGPQSHESVAKGQSPPSQSFDAANIPKSPPSATAHVPKSTPSQSFDATRISKSPPPRSSVTAHVPKSPPSQSFDEARNPDKMQENGLDSKVPATAELQVFPVGKNGRQYLQALLNERAVQYRLLLEQEQDKAKSNVHLELGASAEKLAQATGDTIAACFARLLTTNGNAKAVSDETEKTCAASYFNASAALTHVESRLSKLRDLPKRLREHHYGDDFPAFVTIDASTLREASYADLVGVLATDVVCFERNGTRIFLWSLMHPTRDVEVDVGDHLLFVEEALSAVGFPSHVNLSFAFQDGTEGQIVVAAQTISQAGNGCREPFNVLQNTIGIQLLGMESPVNDPKDTRPSFPIDDLENLLARGSIGRIELCNWDISAKQLTQFKIPLTKTAVPTIFLNNCGLEKPSEALAISEGHCKHKLAFGDKLPLDFDSAKALVATGSVQSLHYTSVLLRRPSELKHAVMLLTSANDRGCSVSFDMVTTKTIRENEGKLRCLASALNDQDVGSPAYSAVNEEINATYKAILARQRAIFEKFKPFGIKQSVFCTNQPEEVYESEDETPTPEEVEASNKKGPLAHLAAEGWKCDHCTVTNSTELLKCAACEKERPGSSASPNFPRASQTFSAPTPSSTGENAAFAMPSSGQVAPDDITPQQQPDGTAIPQPVFGFAQSTQVAAGQVAPQQLGGNATPQLSFGFRQSTQVAAGQVAPQQLGGNATPQLFFGFQPNTQVAAGQAAAGQVAPQQLGGSATPQLFVGFEPSTQVAEGQDAVDQDAASQEVAGQEAAGTEALDQDAASQDADATSQVTEDQVTEDQVTEDQVTEDQVTEDQVTEDQVTEDQVTEGQFSASSKVAATQQVEGTASHSHQTPPRVITRSRSARTVKQPEVQAQTRRSQRLRKKK